MSYQSSKLKLTLLTENDYVSPEVFNANMLKLEAYVTALTQKCSAITPAAYTLSTAYKAFSFGAIIKTGYVLSLSAGCVKVLEPGFVTVDIHAFFTNMAPGDIITVEMTKNGATCYTYTTDNAEYGEGTFIDQTSRLIPVAANDLIGITACNQTATRGILNRDSSYMNVAYHKDLNF